jgi:hypothetical protein
VACTKTSTPGTLYAMATIHWRYVGT